MKLRPGGSVQGWVPYPGLSQEVWRPKGEPFTEADREYLRAQLGVDDPQFEERVEALNCVEGHYLTATVTEENHD